MTGPAGNGDSSRPQNLGMWPFETQADDSGVPTCLQRQEVVPCWGRNALGEDTPWSSEPSHSGWDVTVSPHYLCAGVGGVPH